MTTSRLFFHNRLPRLPVENSVLIYDRRLAKVWGKWIHRFPVSYGVRSGEELKDLSRFPAHVKNLLKKTEGLSSRELTVIAFGGGSVGDFAGFFASVFKRGVRFVQVPSTWLAAIDSAHGGKTALNVEGYKNQIGSFYPAERIHLVKEVLMELGERRFREAQPEAVKVALLDSPRLWSEVRKSETSRQLWSLLPQLIRAKMKIVKRDPKETKGLRHLLNLGHTLGHVIESELGCPHGLAVGSGLRFSLEWSRHLGFLPSTWFESLEGHVTEAASLRRQIRALRNPRRALLQDKKKSRQGRIGFVFLRRPGSPLIREVSVDEILAEMRRQAL
jgi:3-dehydroquinate synthase